MSNNSNINLVGATTGRVVAAFSGSSTTSHASFFHPMQTRSRTSHSTPKQFTNGTFRYPLPHGLTVSVSDLGEPTCFMQASCILEWCIAMMEEFNGLNKNGMWFLVTSPPT